MKAITYFSIALMLFAANICNAQSKYSTNEDTMLELEGIMDSGELLNVRYFYYPNLQAYFDRTTSTYLYTRNGQDWLESAKLPTTLRGYSLSNGKRVPITDYSGDEPYELIKEHMKKFPADYKTKRQAPTKKSGDNLAMK